MSNLDEARYGRACLLVLNICPLILRQVIEDYYKRHGSLSIQDFLEKNKHSLFHLLRRRCCCRFHQSRATPMFISQWNSLYMKNSSSCLKRHRGDCPCQYDAKPGITTSVMDITLCFLIIKNICPGITINMAHIDTIRNIRNHLIHAGSASLDEPTYLSYWSRVENAIIDLAYHVSSALMIDTKKMVKDLETQVMNMTELAKEIKRLVVSEKRIQDVEKNVAEIGDSMDEKMMEIEESLNQTIQKTTQMEESVSQTINKTTQMEESVSQTTQQMTVVEENMSQTTQKMTMMEESVSKTIQKTAEMEESVSQTIQKMTEVEEDVRQTIQKTSEMEESVWQKIKRMLGIEERVNKNTQNVKETEWDMSILKTTVEDHRQEIELLKDEKVKSRTEESSGNIPDINKLKQKLTEIGANMTHVIPISPLQERGEKDMPLELLYASVVIREDYKYAKKGHKRFSSRGSSSQKDTGSAFEQTREVTDPADIFLIDSEIARNIYMLGDAAHGKTTYCMWLLKKWCNAQQRGDKGKIKLDKWEIAMKKFDFVFLLKFRNVNPSRASVIDMICQDLFARGTGYHAAIRHVLSSDKYRSLIIMDGLDEWNPNEGTSKRLTCKGMPNIESVSSNVSCFISMRPWVFPTILKVVEVSDRVIEIHGLSETGMEKVIENVLLNHYRLEKDSSQYTDIHEKIGRYMKDKSLKSFMQIPLLAVVCVQIWYKGEQVGDSMTSFYTTMLNMLIERAQLKHEIPQSFAQTTNFSLPKLLSAKKNIKSFIDVLIKLGKVAFEGLVSKEMKLVFQAEKLEEEIGERELQFALNVGLISQKEASSLVTKNVSVHFFHKSIQEFLAVIYIVTQKEVSDSFCKHLSNVTVIMELSNVIMFICGMCPSLGSILSQRVVCVTDSDTDICKYRESPGSYSKVMELYKLQLSWYRELLYGQTDSPMTQTDSLVTQTDHRVTFHVSDVYLRDNRDPETVKGTRELLSGHHVDVRSLLLWQVPTDEERGITNTELDDFLSNTDKTRSLVKLSIIGDHTVRSVPTLCVPTLRRLDLDTLIITTRISGNVCPPLLTDMSQLRVLSLDNVLLGEGGLGLSPDMVHMERIKLSSVTLGEGGLGLSPNMVHMDRIHLENLTLGEGGLGLSPDMVYIKEVELQSVNMSAAGWEEFVRSISHIQHIFQVVLFNINIDDMSLTMIRSSPDFTIKRDSKDVFGRCVLRFNRVWPPSQLTQDDELLYSRI